MADFYLATFVLPMGAKESPLKLSASGWVLLSGGIQVSYHGVSSTSDNRCLFQVVDNSAGPPGTVI